MKRLDTLYIVVAGQLFNLDAAKPIGLVYGSKNPTFWRDLVSLRHFENMEEVSRMLYSVGKCIDAANGCRDLSYCPADRTYIIQYLESLPQGYPM